LKRDGLYTRGTTPIAQELLSRSFKLTALQPAGLTCGLHFQRSSSGAAYLFNCRGSLQTRGPFSGRRVKVFSPSKHFLCYYYYIFRV